MIITIALKDKKVGIKDIEKGGSQLSGIQLKEFIKYLIDEKYKDLKSSTDLHANNYLFESNLQIDMPTPFEMNEQNAFKNKSEYKKYLLKYSERVANEYLKITEPAKLSRPDGNRFDMGRYVISFTNEELAAFKTVEDKQAFMMKIGYESLCTLGNVKDKKDIKFLYHIVPHMVLNDPDENPHIHLTFSSYTSNHKQVYFYRGDKTTGVIKKFNDLAYRLEKKYPNLLPMETVTQDKKLKPEIDLTIVSALQKLEDEFGGLKYNHEAFTKAFAKAGFTHRFVAKPKDLLISYKGGEFKSISALDTKLKRNLEKFDIIEHSKTKTSTDVAKILSDVAKHVDKHVKDGCPISFQDLNNQLKEQFGVMIGPKEIKRGSKGEYKYEKWSINFIYEDLKFSAVKFGINTNNIKLTLAQVQEMQKELETLEQERKKKLEVKGWEKKSKRDVGNLFWDSENESWEEFTQRQKDAGLKAAVYKLQMQGNMFLDADQKKKFEMTSNNSMSIYAGGTGAAAAMFKLKGFKTVTFTGPNEKFLQDDFYVKATYIGLKVGGDYTPDETTRRKAQELLDNRYQQLVGKNQAKIDMFIEKLLADTDPNKKAQYFYPETHFQYGETIDARSAVDSLLYAVSKGLKPTAIAHIDKTLAEMPLDTIKSVIEDFRNSQAITEDNMKELVKAAGINLTERKTENPKLVAPKNYDPQSGVQAKPAPSTKKSDAPKLDVNDTTLPAATPIVTDSGAVTAKASKVINQPETKPQDKTLGNEHLKALNKLKKAEGGTDG